MMITPGTLRSGRFFVSDRKENEMPIIETVRQTLTQLGVWTAKPLAFLILAAYLVG